MTTENTRILSHPGRYIISGILVLLPLWVTWLVFNFLFGLLSNLGRPWVTGLSRFVRTFSPAVADWMLTPWFNSVLAVVFTLVALYVLGWATNKVIGKRILGWFESLMGRVPMVQAVYGATKKFLKVIQEKPAGAQRVALINFPSSEMKVVGLVSRTLVDETTGKELAVIYVPTAPNPTSGYIEIVPMENVTPTDWTVEEAMRFTVTGGTNAPPTGYATPCPSRRRPGSPLDRALRPCIATGSTYRHDPWPSLQVKPWIDALPPSHPFGIRGELPDDS